MILNDGPLLRHICIIYSFLDWLFVVLFYDVVFKNLANWVHKVYVRKIQSGCILKKYNSGGKYKNKIVSKFWLLHTQRV